MADYAIRGLKKSETLALVSISGLSQDGVLYLFSQLAEKRVNLVLAAHHPSSGQSDEVRICVGATKGMTVYSLAETLAQTEDCPLPSLNPEIAALTLYPRGNGLGFPLALEAVLCQAGIDCLGLSSSLSSCVVLVPEDQAAQAVGILAEAFNLPEHASPVEARVPVVQKP